MDAISFRDGARKGIANSRGHCRAADILAAAGLHGYAISHLVFAVEEAGKTHILTDLAMTTGFFGPREMTAAEVRARLKPRSKRAGLNSHTIKQRFAAIQSWSWPNGDVLGVLGAAKAIPPSAPLGSPEVQAFTAKFGSLIPPGWDGETAKQAGLYVDPAETGSSNVWRSPAQIGVQEWEQLRPRAEACILAEEQRVAAVERFFGFSSPHTTILGSLIRRVGAHITRVTGSRPSTAVAPAIRGDDMI